MPGSVQENLMYIMYCLDRVVTPQANKGGSNFHLLEMVKSLSSVVLGLIWLNRAPQNLVRVRANDGSNRKVTMINRELPGEDSLQYIGILTVYSSLSFP